MRVDSSIENPIGSTKAIRRKLSSRHAKETERVKRELDNLVLQMHAAGISYTDAVREFKKRFLLEVLIRHRGNQCKAAEELGMHRNTLSRTLAELDLDSAQIRKGIRRPPRSVRPLTRPGLQIVGGR